MLSSIIVFDSSFAEGYKGSLMVNKGARSNETFSKVLKSSNIYYSFTSNLTIL